MTSATAIDGPGTADDTGDPNWPWIVEDPPGGSTISGADNADFLNCQAARYRGATDLQCQGSGDEGTGDTGPAPVLTSLTPTTGTAGVQVALKVHGTGFKDGAVVYAGSRALATTFVSDTEVDAVYRPGAAGTAKITVRNADSPASNALDFTITAMPPRPTLTSLVPATAVAGAGGTTVHAHGAGFLNGIKASIGGGAQIATTWVSATEVTFLYTVGAAGSVPVQLFNPINPVGSNIVDFVVTEPPRQPTLTSMTPNTFVGPNHTGETVTLVGTNLDQALTAFSECPATIGPIFGYRADSPTQATLTFTTGLNMTGAPYDCDLSVWISDGAGGSLTSNELPFTVAAAAPAPVTPVLTSMTPNTFVGASLLGQTFVLAGTGLAQGITAYIPADGGGSVVVDSATDTAANCHFGGSGTAGSKLIHVWINDGLGGALTSNDLTYTLT